MLYTRSHRDYRRLFGICLLAACLAGGMGHRAWADDDDDDDDDDDRPFDIHVHLPWVQVDVSRNPPPRPLAEIVEAAPMIESAETSLVVETRGPVHEAFAEPILYDPRPGLIVPQRPPDPIDEIPPDHRPDGENVTWIPGYWAWDDDRPGYLWVSGIWRNMPPGRQFVPGYWREVGNGYQWVSGFWESDEVEAVSYLPEPPESLEGGPVGDPPQPNYVWVPGLWLWRETTYVWRPGYWIPPHDGWAWTPAHYVWSPTGYVFVDGYWDYPVVRRGLLFAPVYVPPPVFARPAFAYQPSVVVNVHALVGQLFARPSYSHYYFGDYYARDYFRTGIYPAFAFHQSRYGYDPILASHLAIQGARRAELLERYREDYRYRRDNPYFRPPRTFRALQQLDRGRDVNPRLASVLDLAQPLSRVVGRSDAPFRFQRVQPDRVQTYRQSVAEVRQYQDQRRRLENMRISGNPVGPTRERRPIEPRRVEPDRDARDRVTPVVPRSEDRVRPTTPGADRRLQTPAERARSADEQARRRPATVERSQDDSRQPRRLELRRSPLTGRSLSQLDRRAAPPARPQDARPDPSVRPGSRRVERREPRDD